MALNNMKRIYSILALAILCGAVMLTACKKEDKSARLMAEFEELEKNIEEQFDDDITSEQADSLMNIYVSKAFALQQAEPQSYAAYEILGNIYFLLDLEQKAQAFAVLDLDSLEAHRLQRYYDAFLAEQKTAVGMPYTDFTAYATSGDVVSISSLVGQKDLLLIDFWASWCGPCRRSMPTIKELLAVHSDHLAVVGISVDEDEEAWLRTVSDLGLTWLQLRDTSDEGSKTYGITSIPHTVLINRDGTILAHNPTPAEIIAFIGE